MLTDLTMTINGKPETAAAAPTLTLLQYLRRTGRVGTKEGCAEGDCGACTVAVVGRGPGGEPRFEAVNSCLLPLGTVAGREVVTVEGLTDQSSGLHPVQQALVDHGGSQCGYCTPGFVMSLFGAYYRGEAGDHAFEGNLCRCTGYLPIRRAAASLGAPAPGDPFRERLEQGRADLPGLRWQQAADAFFRPTSLAEALELLAAHPDARALAGATDLGLELTKFHRPLPVLVSLEAVPELQRFDLREDVAEVGAALPLSHVETLLAGVFPALDEMLRWFAARQIRNRATIGGNLATASPIGDLAPVLLALDASVLLAGTAGERSVPLAGFFRGYRETVLQPGELIVRVDIPRLRPAAASRRLSRSYKVGKRGTDDISIVAAAFTVDLDAEGRVARSRLAYGGVAPVPLRADEVEAFLTGRAWNEATAREAAALLQGAFTPISDLRGSAGYRRRLSGNLLLKFFHETAAEATS